MERSAAAGVAAACPEGLCNGSGWLLDEDNEARPCSCRAKRVRRARSRGLGSGIPRRFREELEGASLDRNPLRDLDPWIHQDVSRFTRKIRENVEAGHGRWYFGEDPGTGKTLLAMVICKAALEKELSVAIYSVPHLLAEIIESYREGSERSYLELFHRLSEVDLLHLDDLGTERPSDWVGEQLYSIVNERWQQKRSIVVTTNIHYDALLERVGARTISRLEGICGGPIPIEGRDSRARISPPAVDLEGADSARLTG